MRDRPISPSAEGMYVNFHATMHSLRHKQADDLSFIVHAKNRDWIVDAGKYNYEHADTFRNHFRNDASAHNTYTVDGRGYELRGGPDHRSIGICTAISKPELAAAVGINEYYRGARIKRIMVFVRAIGLVVLVDELISKNCVTWRSHLHLAHDLLLSESKYQITGQSPYSADCIDIVTDPSSFTKRTVVMGQTDPPLGWASPKWGEKIPAPVVVYETEGPSAIVATAMLIRSVQEPPLSSITTRSLSPGSGEFNVQIGSRSHTLRLRWMPALDVQWME
jgi:hypothetical protein